MDVMGKGSEGVEADINMRKLRRHPRVDLKSFNGDIVSQSRVFSGKITDASTAGLKMVDIEPDIFLKKTHQSYYTLVLSGKGQNHRLVVTPCWIKRKPNGTSADVGLKLVSAPWEWITFVLDQATLRAAGIETSH